METKLKDVIHLYLGCEAIVDQGEPVEECEKIKLNRLDFEYKDAEWFIYRMSPEGEKPYDRFVPIQILKPILRPLDSMTETEARELFINQDKIHQTTDWIEIKLEKNKPSKFGESGWSVCAKYKTQNGNIQSMSGTMSLTKLTVYQFKILLSKGFDLWNLIESNQAIKKS